MKTSFFTRLRPLSQWTTCLLLGISPVLAEDGKPARSPAKSSASETADPAARMRALSEKLNLTQEQQIQLREVFMRDAGAIKELRSKGVENLTDAEKAKLRELMKSRLEEMETILNAEQMAKAKELWAQRRDEGKGAGRPERTKK
jgi:Spy/CpxP family protein refolding chaperone